VYTKSGVALYAFPGTKPNVLRRTLRRLGGQIILLAFVLLDTGSLGFALVAPVWLAPWVTINLTALMLGTLSWSENRRMQREIATAMQRQTEKIRSAERECEALRQRQAEQAQQQAEQARHVRRAEQKLSEAEERLRQEEEEREALRGLQAEQAERLRQAEQQLREAEERLRQVEKERETQRQRQAEQAERQRQAEERREAERRRRPEERQAQKKAGPDRTPASWLMECPGRARELLGFFEEEKNAPLFGRDSQVSALTYHFTRGPGDRPFAVWRDLAANGRQV
jgi:hypothetical protein